MTDQGEPVPEPREKTPLLPLSGLQPNGVSDSKADTSDSLLLRLDQEHDHDHVHDQPPTPNVRKVKEQLMNAAVQPGHSHPMHEQVHSPALLLRLRQSIDHGFHAIATASRKALSKHRRRQQQHQPSTQSIVRAVFIIAILTMLAMTSISPTLLLFMNEAGYTSSQNIAPYVTAAALSTAVPIISNILLTSLASRIGPGRALAVGAIVALFGIVLFALIRHSLLIFMIGYALYASCNSFRVVRVALLSKVVPPQDRTTVLATHALMTPVGALAGPLIWIGAQAFRGRISLFNGLIVLDRFTIDYGVTFLAMVAIYIISASRLRHIVTYSESVNGGNQQTSENDSGADDTSGRSLQPVIIRFADGHEQYVDLQKYRNRVFAFFCAIMLGVNMSGGIYMTAFQPILVNVFNTSDAKLGLIYECIAIFAVIPPLMVAILSRRLMDRRILVIGLTLKLTGMALFLPILGPVREWQVITGFLLVIKASIFFSTASMSLFTKILGSMSTSSLLGLLASASSIGPAVAQILLSSRIVSWFGSFLFGLFALPTVVSLIMIIWPAQWRRLNPNCEFISLVTQEAESQQA